MPKVLLVANHELDKQRSMLRFDRLLQGELVKLGCEVRVVRPPPFFHKLMPTTSGVGKWLGYVDKHLLFPWQLQSVRTWADVVHICDHSNAMYARYVRDVPTLVTCHDLGPVRSALGEDTSCAVSHTGKLLQKWVMCGLKLCDVIACVSDFTRKDVERVLGPSFAARIRLVMNGLDNQFHHLPKEEAGRRLAGVPGVNLARPFLLHVGQSHFRKNRDGVLRIFSLVRKHMDCQMVFAGSPLTAELISLSKDLDIFADVVEVVGPNDHVLEALYNRAMVVLFPSRFEGFGWPVIEAQACGCPVACSDRCSLPEIVLDSALMHSIEDESGFAASILRLRDESERHYWIKAGFENVGRFRPETMARKYIDLYQELLADKPAVIRGTTERSGHGAIEGIEGACDP